MKNTRFLYGIVTIAIVSILAYFISYATSSLSTLNLRVF